MNGSHVRNRGAQIEESGIFSLAVTYRFLKGSTSRLATLPKRKLAILEFTTYLGGSVEI